MFKAFANAWKIDDLRKKFLFTLFIILIYRIGACITVPFIGYAAMEQGTNDYLQNWFNSYLGLGELKSINLFNLMSGDSFSKGNLFALGVSPYITASIVMQLLSVAIPPLERLAKSEGGKEKIDQITRYVTIGLSLLYSIGYYITLNSRGAVTQDGFFYAVVIILCYCAGSSLVMWLAEKINEKGIGNGVSIILFANIVSRAPAILMQIIDIIESDPIGGTIYSLALCVLMLFLLWFIIFISDSERRIPVQYAKRVVGRKMYGGQNTNLPIKLNMAGVMPIIFASTIINLPQTIALFFAPKEGSWWYTFVSYWGSLSSKNMIVAQPIYIILNLGLILAFAYFYVAISFNPTEVSQNIQKNGGAVPGIRPGRATADYIKKVLSKIVLIGAIALSIISVVPMIIQYVVNICTGDAYMIQDFIMGGSSIIICVGVILETLKEIETQMSMRHYKGFLE